MTATATQDDDLIIFNDEADDTTSQQDGNDWAQDESQAQDVEESLIIEDAWETSKNETVEDLISFSEEETVPSEEKAQIADNTADASEDLISFETTETPTEESKVEDKIEMPELLIETQEDTNTEATIESNTENPTELDQEGAQDLSLESEVAPETNSEDLKKELIDIQDTPEGASFEDMGIDLEKLGDKEAENLEWMDLSLDTLTGDDISLDLENAGAAEIDSKSEEVLEEAAQDISEDIDSIEDFTAGLPADIDESTLVWILDATIIKLNKREEVATEQIEWIKSEVETVQSEIRELKSEERAKKKEITQLEAEKKKIVTTRESIEKMKEAA